MGFVVEDGTGIVGANAYITVDFADEYHRDRSNVEWTQRGVPERQAAIVKATRYIDTEFSFPWGIRVKRDQGLLWPRTGATDYEGFSITGIHFSIKNAVADLALEIIKGEDITAAQDRQTVSETVGPISVTYAAGAAPRKTFPYVAKMLMRYGLIGSQNTLKVVRS